MNHLSRFKIVYVQILVAVAASIGAELGAFKEMTKEQLAALTWVTWTLCATSIIVNVGNTLTAIFNPPPAPKPPSTP
jgi:hypothetical protein